MMRFIAVVVLLSAGYVLGGVMAQRSITQAFQTPEGVSLCRALIRESDR